MSTLSLAWTHFRNRPRRGGRWIQLGYVLADVFFVLAGALLVCSLRLGSRWIVTLGRGEFSKFPQASLPPQYLGFLLVYTPVLVLFCQTRALYRTPRDRSALDETLGVFQAVGLSSLIVTAFLYLSKQDISRLLVGSCAIANVFSLSGWRLWKRQMIRLRVSKGEGLRNVLIIGAGRVGQTLAAYFDNNKHLGYVVRGFLDQNHSGQPRILGRIENLAQIARAEFVDEIFITTPSERELVKAVVLEARKNRLDVNVVPELYDGLGWRVPLDFVGDFPVMALHREPIPALGLLIKRTIDLTVSVAGLVFLAPLLAAIAVAIGVDSGGPFLYRSRRVGKKGRSFIFYKFRTMVADADARKNDLRRLNQRCGPFFKMENDPRTTRIGRFLRRYSLDELPQLWNVLKGNMSLVGPRPHPLDDCEHYRLEHLRRLDVTPGITGLWQVSARRDPSFEKSLALDLDYIANWDLWLDIKILLKTAPAVFAGQGQ